METNYSKHAVVWDWDDYDNSLEYEFWSKMSSKYGKHILSAMGALGQTGAYLAKKDFTVTVLDYTEEMIAEGIKRFGNIKGLEFIHADICNFKLKDSTFDFCFTSDLNGLSSIDDVEKAVKNINKHLRIGGGFGIEIFLPFKNSFKAPMKRFDPRVPKGDGIKIWKEGESSYNSDTMTYNIHQIIYIEENGIVKNFNHNVTLQLYNKDYLTNIIMDCGFKKVDEYCDYDFNKNEDNTKNQYVEFVKIVD